MQSRGKGQYVASCIDHDRDTDTEPHMAARPSSGGYAACERHSADHAVSKLSEFARQQE